jgi:glycosyltransferase involved in cell wall biosynthesis
MIKVAALTSGQHIPSARFRIRQHVYSLRDMGIYVREYIPIVNRYALLPGILRNVKHNYVLPLYAFGGIAKVAVCAPGIISSWNAQVTWLERSLLPGYLTLEPLLKKPLVFDVDDSIWLSRPFGRSAAIQIAKHADTIIAGNKYLADWLTRWARDIRIVPTAVDTDRFRPTDPSTKSTNKFFTIGWTGTASNLVFLYDIEESLTRFVQDHKYTFLMVVSDAIPAFRKFPSDKMKYIPWTPICEAEAIRQMDVGLMPLPDNEWTRGKCSFKMLQYMASAIPVIVSPVGMNTEVLSMGNVGLSAATPGEWYEALDEIFHHPKWHMEWGKTGREVVKRHFSSKIISAQLGSIFKDLT